MQNTSDFKMLDRQVVNTILSMPERNMFFRATTSWVGFTGLPIVEFEVQREREAGGDVSGPLGLLVKYAFTNIVAFTTIPLQFVTVGGGICFLGSLILMIYSLVQYFYRTCSGRIHNDASGDASSDWKRDHAEPWYHRILYGEDL